MAVEVEQVQEVVGAGDVVAPSSMAAKPMPPAAPDPGRGRRCRRRCAGAGEGGDEVVQSGVEWRDLCWGGALLGPVTAAAPVEPGQRAGDVAGDDDLDPVEIDALVVSTVDPVQVLGGGRQQLAGVGRGSGNRGRPACRFRRRCWRDRPGRGPSVCGSASALRGWLRRSRSSMRSSGRATPPGRVASPQVLATSTTAVSPSNAIDTRWWSCPVAPCTVTGKRMNPLARAAATLPSPPSASGRVLLCAPASARPRQVVGDLGCGEAAFELVRCDQDFHGVLPSSDGGQAGWSDGESLAAAHGDTVGGVRSLLTLSPLDPLVAGSPGVPGWSVTGSQRARRC